MLHTSSGGLHMMPRDFARLGWMRQHEKCFPEDIRPYAWSLWDDMGWLRQLCTIDGELELYEMQRYYEAAVLPAQVIRHHGFEPAEFLHQPLFCYRLAALP
jgi:hypothetical protein